MGTVPALDPPRTALLVLDLQPATLAALPGAGRDALVARVRIGFTEADWRAAPERNKAFAPLATLRLLHHAAPETSFHGRLAPQEHDIVVRKVRHGAMSTTDLDGRLRERNVTTLVVAGVSTGGAVLSTVLDAAGLRAAVRGARRRSAGPGAAPTAARR